MHPIKLKFPVILIAYQVAILIANSEATNSDLDNVIQAPLGRQKRAIEINLCPKEPAKLDDPVKTSLYIYSPTLRHDIRITPQNNDIKALGFNISQPTMFFTHAYTEDYKTKWLKQVRQNYNDMFSNGKQPNFNMFFFDWSTYSKKLYNVAVSYVPHVADVLSQFLNELAEVHGYDLSKMHLYSFSISTHISGLASRQLHNNLKVGRITALDSTGVCMHDNTQFALKYGLKPTDAKMVVTGHYDRDGFGPKRNIGGVDIFVNEGKNQPGCMLPATSHYRAVSQAIHPANRKCFNVAYACKSRQAFLAGECGDCGEKGEKCYYMDSLNEHLIKDQIGPLPDYPLNTVMYIETGDKEPLCKLHYQFVVQMKSDASKSSLSLLSSGSVKLTVSPFLNFRPKHSAGNNRFTLLHLRSQRLKGINKIKVDIESYSISVAEFLNQVDHVEFNFMSHPVAATRAKRSLKFCPDTEKSLLIEC